jgi:hypothetical protein
MATEPCYSEDFRSIGQALEAKDIRSFELKRTGDSYVLQGVPSAETSLRSKLHKFKFRFRSGSDAETLTLALSDVAELSQKGKAKRFVPGRLPDFRRLSNVARTIGAYLDAKQAKFIALQVRPLTVTLSYQDKDGQQQVEDRTIRSFYNLSLELSDRREEPKEDSTAEQPAG